jgi:hypothetical protein
MKLLHKTFRADKSAIDIVKKAKHTNFVRTNSVLSVLCEMSRIANRRSGNKHGVTYTLGRSPDTFYLSDLEKKFLTEGAIAYEFNITTFSLPLDENDILKAVKTTHDGWLTRMERFVNDTGLDFTVNRIPKTETLPNVESHNRAFMFSNALTERRDGIDNNLFGRHCVPLYFESNPPIRDTCDVIFLLYYVIVPNTRIEINKDKEIKWIGGEPRLDVR